MTEQKTARIAYWDIAKGILVFFVVLTHAILRYRYYDQVKGLFDVLILLIMPVFAVISGYLSRGEGAAKGKNLIKLIALYCVFNSMYVVWFAIVEHYYQITEPYYVHWYLIALLVWRFVTARYKPKPWMVPLFFIVAILIGFWQDIGNEFALGRIVCFYPFFLTGYLLPEKTAARFLLKKSKLRVVLGVVLMAAAVTGVVLISQFYEYRYWLTWHFMMNYYTDMSHFYLRIGALALATLFVAGFLFCVPTGGRGAGLIQSWGRNSLWVFLMHRPFTIIFSELFGAYNGWFYPAVLALTLVITLIFGSDQVASRLNRVLDGFLDVLSEKGSAPRGKRLAVTAVCWAFAILVLALPIAGFLTGIQG